MVSSPGSYLVNLDSGKPAPGLSRPDKRVPQCSDPRTPCIRVLNDNFRSPSSATKQSRFRYGEIIANRLMDGASRIEKIVWTSVVGFSERPCPVRVMHVAHMRYE